MPAGRLCPFLAAFWVLGISTESVPASEQESPEESGT